MKRRFNYTGRKRIPRKNISIVLNRDQQGRIRSFRATINSGGLNLPPDARVYVEAYHREELQRFDFGTWGSISPPPDTRLTGLAHTENLKFRVLVVDESGEHGKILAQADRIAPEVPADRRPILPVEFLDLGQQIWRVEFTGDEGAPLLIINNRIPNIENMAKTDPCFVMYVYPAVIREVLTRMIFIDRVDNISDPSVDWHRDWLEFSRGILPSEGPPEAILDPTANGNSEDAVKWIERVVEEFCSSRNEWERYIRLLEGEKT
ncbi:MAG: hypothetical protein H5T50_04900 [Nitrososphaeria archaeon]|nr:hypothetical protein [Nitrososphaeria archaeon]